MDIINGLAASLLETLPLVPAAIGFYIALRALKFPDLTVEGSFVLGAVISGYFIHENLNPWIAIICAIVSGAFAGVITAFWNLVLKIPAFTSGIITTFSLTWVNYLVLKKISNTGAQTTTEILDNKGIFQGAKDIDIKNLSFFGEINSMQILMISVIVFTVVCFVGVFLKSKKGLLLRAYGSERKAGNLYNKKYYYSIYGGLALSNALVGLSGALYAQLNSLVNLEKGATLLIPLLASVIFGEFIVVYLWGKIRKEDLKPLLSRPYGMALSPFFGFLLYNIIVLFSGAILMPASNIDSFHKYIVIAIAIALVLVVRSKERSEKMINDLI